MEEIEEKEKIKFRMIYRTKIFAHAPVQNRAIEWDFPAQVQILLAASHIEHLYLEV